MRLGSYILSFIIIFLFTVFALANDELIRVVIFPELMAINTTKVVYLPIYLLTCLAILVGVLSGVLIEYIRNFKLRQDLKGNRKKILKIEEELRRSKEKLLNEEEKIFDLLD